MRTRSETLFSAIAFAVGAIAGFILIMLSATAHAAVGYADNATIGEMKAIDPDTNLPVQLPGLEVDYDARITGDLVNVTVEQRFSNPFSKPVEAQYAFPLHEGAAVHAMEMRLPDEIIRAQIKEKKEAKEIYETAKAEGKAASLLDQHRPNMFTQKVANLMPGAEITVVLEYVHPVPRVDGQYVLTLPLVIGERFSPGDMSGNELVKGSGETHELPAGAGIKNEVSPPVRVNVYVDSGQALAKVESRTHALDVERVAANRYIVGLAAGRIPTDRHFELRYQLAGDATTVGAMTAWDDAKRFGHGSILIEPPTNVADEDAVRREMVFLLDCSGSMSGYPMEASKVFMTHALKNLRPNDTFRVIRFSDAATEFSTMPLKATPENIARGLQYVQELHGMGGTHMRAGITQALTVPPPKNTLRLVTFLTDGYIGNDYEIIRQVRSEIGDARLFAIGVGRSPNTYLMDELGRMGRGWTRYIDPTDQVASTSRALATKLQTPVLTDIEIDWGGAPVQDVYPRLIPDLFAGDGLRLSMMFTGKGAYKGRVFGKNAAGKAVEFPFTINLDSSKTYTPRAMEVTWARALVKDSMQELLTPNEFRLDGSDNETLRQRIINTGLEYSIVTQWTSFVAVSHKVVNPAADLARNGAKNTGSANQPLLANLAPSASSTPEPGTLGGLLLMGAAAFAARRRRREEA